MTPVYIIIGKYGNKHYYKDKAMTILHREDGPAAEHANGCKEWYSNGKHHREDGPAVEYANGHKAWFLDGKLHREDGPAVELAGGHKEWYVNGKRHREDGPAVEYADGHKAWFIDGVSLSEQEFLLKTAKEIVLTMDEIASKFGIEVSKLKIQK
jgi:hypothetical protein